MQRDSCEVHAVFGNIFAKFLGGSGGNFGKMLA
jgi:hypothetical protein